MALSKIQLYCALFAISLTTHLSIGVDKSSIFEKTGVLDCLSATARHLVLGISLLLSTILIFINAVFLDKYGPKKSNFIFVGFLRILSLLIELSMLYYWKSKNLLTESSEIFYPKI
ncbi:MAG: hypothetical protein MHPSP_002346, partial [Paramarteilia canceri]